MSTLHTWNSLSSWVSDKDVDENIASALSDSSLKSRYMGENAASERAYNKLIDEGLKTHSIQRALENYQNVVGQLGFHSQLITEGPKGVYSIHFLPDGDSKGIDPSECPTLTISATDENGISVHNGMPSINALTWVRQANGRVGLASSLAVGINNAAAELQRNMKSFNSVHMKQRVNNVRISTSSTVNAVTSKNPGLTSKNQKQNYNDLLNLGSIKEIRSALARTMSGQSLTSDYYSTLYEVYSKELEKVGIQNEKKFFQSLTNLEQGAKGISGVKDLEKYVKEQYSPLFNTVWKKDLKNFYTQLYDVGFFHGSKKEGSPNSFQLWEMPVAARSLVLKSSRKPEQNARILQKLYGEKSKGFAPSLISAPNQYTKKELQNGEDRKNLYIAGELNDSDIKAAYDDLMKELGEPGGKSIDGKFFKDVLKGLASDGSLFAAQIYDDFRVKYNDIKKIRRGTMKPALEKLAKQRLTDEEYNTFNKIQDAQEQLNYLEGLEHTSRKGIKHQVGSQIIKDAAFKASGAHPKSGKVLDGVYYDAESQRYIATLEQKIKSGTITMRGGTGSDTRSVASIITNELLGRAFLKHGYNEEEVYEHDTNGNRLYDTNGRPILRMTYARQVHDYQDKTMHNDFMGVLQYIVSNLFEQGGGRTIGNEAAGVANVLETFKSGTSKHNHFQGLLRSNGYGGLEFNNSAFDQLLQSKGVVDTFKELAEFGADLGIYRRNKNGKLFEDIYDESDPTKVVGFRNADNVWLPTAQELGPAAIDRWEGIYKDGAKMRFGAQELGSLRATIGNLNRLGRTKEAALYEDMIRPLENALAKKQEHYLPYMRNIEYLSGKYGDSFDADYEGKRKAWQDNDYNLLLTAEDFKGMDTESKYSDYDQGLIIGSPEKTLAGWLQVKRSLKYSELQKKYGRDELEKRGIYGANDIQALFSTGDRLYIDDQGNIGGNIVLPIGETSVAKDANGNKIHDDNGNLLTKMDEGAQQAQVLLRAGLNLVNSPDYNIAAAKKAGIKIAEGTQKYQEAVLRGSIHDKYNTIESNNSGYVLLQSMSTLAGDVFKKSGLFDNENKTPQMVMNSSDYKRMLGTEVQQILDSTSDMSDEEALRNLTELDKFYSSMTGQGATDFGQVSDTSQKIKMLQQAWSGKQGKARIQQISDSLNIDKDTFRKNNLDATMGLWRSPTLKMLDDLVHGGAVISDRLVQAGHLMMDPNFAASIKADFDGDRIAIFRALYSGDYATASTLMQNYGAKLASAQRVAGEVEQSYKVGNIEELNSITDESIQNAKESAIQAGSKGAGIYGNLNYAFRGGLQKYGASYSSILPGEDIGGKNNGAIGGELAQRIASTLYQEGINIKNTKATVLKKYGYLNPQQAEESLMYRMAQARTWNDYDALVSALTLGEDLGVFNPKKGYLKSNVLADIGLSELDLYEKDPQKSEFYTNIFDAAIKRATDRGDAELVKRLSDERASFANGNPIKLSKELIAEAITNTSVGLNGYLNKSGTNLGNIVADQFAYIPGYERYAGAYISSSNKGLQGLSTTSLDKLERMGLITTAQRTDRQNSPTATKAELTSLYDWAGYSFGSPYKQYNDAVKTANNELNKIKSGEGPSIYRSSTGIVNGVMQTYASSEMLGTISDALDTIVDHPDDSAAMDKWRKFVPSDLKQFTGTVVGTFIHSFVEAATASLTDNTKTVDIDAIRKNVIDTPEMQRATNRLRKFYSLQGITEDEQDEYIENAISRGLFHVNTVQDLLRVDGKNKIGSKIVAKELGLLGFSGNSINTGIADLIFSTREKNKITGEDEHYLNILDYKNYAGGEGSADAVAQLVTYYNDIVTLRQDILRATKATTSITAQDYLKSNSAIAQMWEKRYLNPNDHAAQEREKEWARIYSDDTGLDEAKIKQAREEYANQQIAEFTNLFNELKDTDLKFRLGVSVAGGKGIGTYYEVNPNDTLVRALSNYFGLGEGKPLSDTDKESLQHLLKVTRREVFDDKTYREARGEKSAFNTALDKLEDYWEKYDELQSINQQLENIENDPTKEKNYSLIEELNKKKRKLETTLNGTGGKNSKDKGLQGEVNKLISRLKATSPEDYGDITQIQSILEQNSDKYGITGKMDAYQRATKLYSKYNQQASSLAAILNSDTAKSAYSQEELSQMQESYDKLKAGVIDSLTRWIQQLQLNIVAGLNGSSLNEEQKSNLEAEFNKIQDQFTSGKEAQDKASSKQAEITIAKTKQGHVAEVTQAYGDVYNNQRAIKTLEKQIREETDDTRKAYLKEELKAAKEMLDIAQKTVEELQGHKEWGGRNGILATGKRMADAQEAVNQQKEEKAAEAERKQNAKTYEGMLRQKTQLETQIYSDQRSKEVSMSPRKQELYQDRIDVNTEELNELNASIKELVNRLGKNKEFNEDKTKLDAKYERIGAKGMIGANLRMKESQTFFGSIGSSFKSMFDRFINYSAAYKIIESIRKGISQVTTYAKQLDKAIEQVRITTGATKETAQETVKEYSNMASELSASTVEVANSATEWLRQGYEMADVNDLVTSTMYLSKLGLISTEEATKDLTSAMKGFKLEASDAMSIVDKLTNLDVNAATTAGEIATALSEFANTASLSGIDIDSAAAMATTIMDVSQMSGSSAGNALKTIISRYGNVKSGAYVNMTSGNSDESSENLNDVEKVLHQVGISIRDTANEFREFDDVLEDLSAVWDTLDSVSKNAIATAMAGTRQREAFVTLMNNMDKYHELLEVSAESAGTAARKYKSYQEQFEASQKRLQSAWESLAQNSEIQSTLTMLNDFLTGLVKAAPTIIKYASRFLVMMNANKLPGALPGIGQFLGITPFVQSFKNIKNGEGGLKGGLKNIILNTGNGQPGNATGATSAVASNVSAIANNTANILSYISNGKATGVRGRTIATNSNSLIANRYQDTVAFDKNGRMYYKHNFTDQNGVVHRGGTTVAQQDQAQYQQGYISAGVIRGTNAAAGAVMGAMTASTTYKVDGVSYEMDKSTLAASRGTTALVQGLGAMVSPIIGQLAGVLMDGLWKLVFGPLMEREKVARKERVALANEQLDILNKNSDNVQTLYDIAQKNETRTAEDNSTFNETLEEYLLNISGGDNAEKQLRQDIVKYLNENLDLTEYGLSEDANLYDIVDAIKGNQEDEIALTRALLIAQKEAEFTAGIQSREEEIHDIYKEANQAMIDGGYTADVKKTAWANIIKAFATTGLAHLIVGSGSSGALGAGIGAGISAYNTTLENYIDEEDDLQERIIKLQTQLSDEIAKGGDADDEQISILEDVLESTQSIKAKLDSLYKEEDIEQLSLSAFKTSYNGVNLQEMTSYALKQLGLDQIKELIAEQFIEDGGALAVRTYNSLGDYTDYFNEIFASALKDDDLSVLKKFFDGEVYTLKEALELPGQGLGGYTDQILENFANAIGTTVDELVDYEEQFGEITLGDWYLTDEELQTKLETISEYIGDWASNSKTIVEKQTDIISNFPQLIKYLGNTRDLMKELFKLSESYAEIQIQSQYNNILSSESVYEDFLKQIKNDTEIQTLLNNDKSFASLTNLSGLQTWITRNKSVAGNEAIAQKLSEYVTSYFGNGELVSDTLQENINTALEYQIGLLDDELNQLEEQKQALEEINQQRQYENDLVEARLKLEDAQENKNRTWREGVGWVYEADQAAIQEAQDNLDEVQNQKLISTLEVQTDILTQLKNSLDINSVEEQEANKQLWDLYMEKFNEKFGETTIAQFKTGIIEEQKGTTKTLNELWTGGLQVEEKNKQSTLSELNKAWNENIVGNTGLTMSGLYQKIASGKASASEKAAYFSGLSSYQNTYKNAINSGLISASDLADSDMIHAGINSTVLDSSGNVVAQNDDTADNKTAPYWLFTGASMHSTYKNDTQYKGVRADYPTVLTDDMREALFVDGDVYRVYNNSSTSQAMGKVQNEFKTYSSLAEVPDGLYFTYHGLFKDKYFAVMNGQLYEVEVEEDTHKSASNGYYPDSESSSSSAGQVVSSGYAKGSNRSSGSANGHVISSAYATGSIDSLTGLSMINELGTEAIITPQGTITALPAHSGVVPADITKNLWGLGEIAPSIMRVIDHYDPTNLKAATQSIITDESFNVSNLTMNVNADNSFDADAFVESIKTRVALTRNSR